VSGVPSASVHVNGRLAIPRDELEFRATRSSGPGGQHVNRTASRVEVVWRVRDSRVLGDADRARLLERLAPRLSDDGALRVTASDTRSQTRNRTLAEGRLAELVRRALVVPKVRRPTRPSRAVRAARAADKQRHSERKRERRDRGDE